MTRAASALVSLCLGTGFLLAGAAPTVAQTADLPPAADWAGPYAAVTFGAVRSENEAEIGDVQGTLLPPDVSLGVLPRSIDGFETSGFAGVAVGTNYQRGGFVTGIEAGLARLDYDGLVRHSKDGPFPPPGGALIVETNTSYRTEIDTLATLRWRGGLASGRNLVFISAGLAGGQVRNEFGFNVTDLPPPLPRPYAAPTADREAFRWGYVIGAGIERQVSERVSIRAEFMHFDLEDVTLTGSDPETPGFTEESVEYTFENRGSMAIIGISFSF